MSALQRANPVFATGVFQVLNPGEVPIGTPLFVVVSQGTPNWTGARAGAGTGRLTWGSGEAVDAAESTVFAASGTAARFVEVAGQTDLTLDLTARDFAGAAADNVTVHFLVLRVR